MMFIFTKYDEDILFSKYLGIFLNFCLATMYLNLYLERIQNMNIRGNI